MTRRLIESIPDGVYRFTDQLDDDGVSTQPVPIIVAITIHGDSATVDFTGSAPQQAGSVNAVLAITLSAVYYVFRCLLGLDVPNNSGCLVPIQVIAPPGTVVNAMSPAPVAGETWRPPSALWTYCLVPFPALVRIRYLLPARGR
jgi:N-methylhydantoinase B